MIVNAITTELNPNAVVQYRPISVVGKISSLDRNPNIIRGGEGQKRLRLCGVRRRERRQSRPLLFLFAVLRTTDMSKKVEG